MSKEVIMTAVLASVLTVVMIIGKEKLIDKKP
jgi:hypothetical protein